MIDDLDWYGPETATFGDRLSAAIEKSGMTQKLVAKRLGIKLVTLKSWEQDISEPRANRLSMLAGLLGVSVMWLLHGEGDGVEHSPSQLSRLKANELRQLCEARGVASDGSKRTLLQRLAEGRRVGPSAR